MFLISSFFLLISLLNILSLCTYSNSPKREDFQSELNGKKIDLYFLTNSNGYEISITNYGGIIVSIFVPNKFHQFENIVFGYSSLKEYIINQKKEKKINSLLGRFCAQIKNGEFNLDNKTYKLNNYSNFGEKVWTPVQINSNELRLFYTSEDGEEGFPGKLHVEVDYTLNDNNEFKISYSAITTKKTIINLSQRLFINLKGNFSGEINNHLVELNSKFYLPFDEDKIPLGSINLVDNTYLDFQKEKKLGQKNLDNYFILDKNKFEKNQKINFGAFLEEKKTGRKLKIITSEPGLYIQTDKRGISFEAMHFPNSPNVGHFPSTILKPGEIYRQETIYQFELSEG